ncbi:MAG: hypothetical protein LBV47_00945 [Bacteroidales bacterium]|nr:hypothetical protein [Bacteroidales bacterium]
MKTTILILTVSVLGILVSCCKVLFPDEKLSMKRVDYNGNQLRLDGYYYYHDNNGYTLVLFLYRTGTMLLTRAYLSADLDIVEKQMISQYENLKKEKTRWGVFSVVDHKIEYEEWVAPDEGRLTVCKTTGNIVNDTTFCITKRFYSYNNKTYHVNDVWHFKEFFPKPDSTNVFIK